MPLRRGPCEIRRKRAAKTRGSAMNCGYPLDRGVGGGSPGSVGHSRTRIELGRRTPVAVFAGGVLRGSRAYFMPENRNRTRGKGVEGEADGEALLPSSKTAQKLKETVSTRVVDL